VRIECSLLEEPGNIWQSREVWLISALNMKNTISRDVTPYSFVVKCQTIQSQIAEDNAHGNYLYSCDGHTYMQLAYVGPCIPSRILQPAENWRTRSAGRNITSISRTRRSILSRAMLRGICDAMWNNLNVTKRSCRLNWTVIHVKPGTYHFQLPHSSRRPTKYVD
jgi:hypothetical protein